MVEDSAKKVTASIDPLAWPARCPRPQPPMISSETVTNTTMALVGVRRVGCTWPR